MWTQCEARGWRQGRHTCGHNSAWRFYATCVILESKDRIPLPWLEIRSDKLACDGCESDANLELLYTTLFGTISACPQQIGVLKRW